MIACMDHFTPVEKVLRQEEVRPFDELIVTWNGNRPAEGNYEFYVRVKVDEWSSWLHYASWGKEGQTSYKEADGVARTYQDTIDVLKGKATAYEVKIEGEGLTSLHVYTNGDKGMLCEKRDFAPLVLDLLGLSQMALDFEKKEHICSATSTTAVVRFLTGNSVDPIQFAKNSWDKGFDIFGNWVFVVANASTFLGKNWFAWVERLNGFEDIYKRLEEKSPVVVSVRTPFPGSAMEYPSGHLIVVIGYKEGKVICMDPAFSSDEKTVVSYALSDFLAAWERRGKIVYVFKSAS